MFLHAGASLHGHEFSDRQAPANNTAHAAHRIRSAFTAREPPRPSAASEATRDHSTPGSATHRTPDRPTAQRYEPDGLLRRDPVVRFEKEPIILEESAATTSWDVTSENESVSASEFSELGSLDAAAPSRFTKRRARRSPRKATNFLLAYPPPGLRTKQRRFVQVRPRLVLQLQQLSADKRPKPTLDVLSTSIVAGAPLVPRAVRQHLPDILGAKKGHLGRDDLVLAESEDYDAPINAGHSPKDIDKRQVVAVISPVVQPKGAAAKGDNASQTDIILADGTTWSARILPGGSYEFSRLDELGVLTTARWARRAAKSKPKASASTIPRLVPQEDGCRFTFSVIDPFSRRHPIMATLTASGLEVLDSYTTVSGSAGLQPPVRVYSRDLDGVSHDTASSASPVSPDGRTTLPVDEATKTLITVTALWVSIKEAQSPSQADSTSKATTQSQDPEPRAARSVSQCVRAATFPSLGTGNSSTATPAANPSVPSDQSLTKVASTRPRRALSTGAAYLQRRKERFGHDPPPHADLLTESDEADDQKLPDSGVEGSPREKRGMYGKIRAWGHKITLHSRKSSHGDD